VEALLDERLGRRGFRAALELEAREAAAPHHKKKAGEKAAKHREEKAADEGGKEDRKAADTKAADAKPAAEPAKKHHKADVSPKPAATQ